MPKRVDKYLGGVLREWTADFRSAARTDSLSLFRRHLKRLSLPDEPRLLLEGTIQIMAFCAYYAALDGQQKGFRDLLRLQRYDPAQAPRARYEFTFDVYGKTFARVLVDAKVTNLDLADLYNHPWFNLEAVGYDDIWITRTDRRALTTQDKRFLEEEVEYDLRFDYSEDEVDFWFDDSLNRRALLVHVQDHEELDGGRRQRSDSGQAENRGR
jgi:hypothetical protein